MARGPELDGHIVRSGPLSDSAKLDSCEEAHDSSPRTCWTKTK